MKAPDLVEIGALPDAGSRAAFVLRFGQPCAAWLLFATRRRMRLFGAVRYFVPKGEELPAWFQVAFEYVRDHRASKWSTEVVTERGIKTHVISRRKKPLPSAIVPVGVS